MFGLEISVWLNGANTIPGFTETVAWKKFFRKIWKRRKLERRNIFGGIRF